MRFWILGLAVLAAACNHQTASHCGDGVVTGEERCDPAASLACSDYDPAYVSGTLICGAAGTANQCRVDTTACSRTCGNGVIDIGASEECDGTELGDATCTTEEPGSTGGALTCTDTCTIDSTACTDVPLARLELDMASYVVPGTVLLGATGTVTVRVTNVGGMPATGVVAGPLAGELAVSSNPCPPSLAPGASCNLTVRFAPEVAGMRSDMISVDSDQTVPVMATVSGTGGARVSVSLGSVGGGTGSVTSMPLGLDCPTGTCDRVFTEASVTLSAVAGTGSAFGGWNVPACGAATPCPLALDRSWDVTATFLGPPVLAFDAAAYTVPGTIVIGATGNVVVRVTNTGPRSATGFTAMSSAADFQATHACGQTIAAGATCDLTVTFAPTAPGPRSTMLMIDSDQTAAQSVAVSANGTCAAGRTWCGTSCVDLQANAGNCGACGYEVRGGRTCQLGRPFPGWVPMPVAPWGPERPRIQSWTGRRFMVMTDSHEYFFDPVANTWSPPDAFPRPPAAFNYSSDGEYSWAKVPRRDMVAIHDGTTSVDGDQLWMFTHPAAGAATWSSPGSPTLELRRGATVVATVTDVFVGWGLSHDTIVRYNLATSTFARSATHGLNCGGGFSRYQNPLAIVGDAVLTHGGISQNIGFCQDVDATRTTLPAMANWVSVGAVLESRAYHTFVEFDGHLLFGGGRKTSSGTSSCHTSGLWEVNVVTGAMLAVSPFPQPRLNTANPADTPSESFVVRTGRGVMVWGGRQPRCDNNTMDVVAGGSIGVSAGAMGGITWAALPSAGEPIPRSGFPNNHWGWGSAQPMWTGYEAVVFGGANIMTALVNGSTYQPPVGCVCPSADAEACDGVTALPSPNTCAPM